MKYGEADLVVSRLIVALKESHMTKYPEDTERWATDYALGYVSSMLASIMCQSEDAAQAVQDRMLTSERYLQSLKDDEEENLEIDLDGGLSAINE